jgi:hypothetical protein
MKLLIKYLFMFVAMAGIALSCGDNGADSENPTKGELVISVSPMTNGVAVISDNGEDAAVFTVAYDGEDVTASAVISQKSGPVAVSVEEGEFKTTQAGTYTFTAEYDEVVSDEVTVVVNEEQKPADRLTLKADKTTIQNDGKEKVTFSVWLNEKNVTSSATITKNGEVFQGCEFSTLMADPVKFQAKYKEMTSSVLTITVVVMPRLELSVDNNVVLIEPDGRANKPRFTVMQAGVDVTNLCTFYDVKEGANLQGRTFSSTTVGAHEIYAYLTEHAAIPGHHISNTIEVGVAHLPDFSDNFDAGRTLFKNTAFFLFTATWCGPCCAMKDGLKRIGFRGNNLVPVNFYGSEKSATKVDERSMTDKIKGQVKSRFSWTSIPTVIYNLKTKYGGTALNDLDNYITETALTGLKVSSSISGSTVNFTASVGAQKAGTYYVGALLIEDHVICEQQLYPESLGKDKNYDHTNVARALVTSSVYGDLVGTFAAGDVKSKNFSITVPSKCNKANISLVVYTLYADAKGNMIIDNSVKMPVNGTTGFAYINN